MDTLKSIAKPCIGPKAKLLLSALGTRTLPLPMLALIPVRLSTPTVEVQVAKVDLPEPEEPRFSIMMCFHLLERLPLWNLLRFSIFVLSLALNTV